MYVCESDWFTQYGPVKHWVHCKSISHPPTKLACVRYWPRTPCIQAQWYKTRFSGYSKQYYGARDRQAGESFTTATTDESRDICCFASLWETSGNNVLCSKQTQRQFRSMLSCSKKHFISCLLHANVCLPIVEQIHTDQYEALTCCA